MEQRREAPTEREAREVILRAIDAQCNKRSPLVYIIICQLCVPASPGISGREAQVERGGEVERAQPPSYYY